MKWTKKESKALDNLITGYGRISLLPKESKDKLFEYVRQFHVNAFKLKERPEPKGLVI